jgi:chemotaxis protein histidine kinase CheA
MRRFGGDIELVQSLVGKGTTFKIRVPVKSE